MERGEGGGIPYREYCPFLLLGGGDVFVVLCEKVIYIYTMAARIRILN